MEDQVKEFLLESNAIEGVFGDECFEAALKAWEFMQGASGMNEYNVLETHRILMQPRDAWEESTIAIIGKDGIGTFRNSAIYVGGIAAINALKIHEELEKWYEAMNKKPINTVYHKNKRSKELHVFYEKIHPFMDGNGRTGRIFMNWWRVKNGMPILVIHTGEEQMDYYKWFQK